MPRRKPSPSSTPISTEFPPASSQESREAQLISLAYDLAERRLREGTASSQEVVHFLKMGSQKDRLEREIMSEQKKLVTAKTGSYESGKRLEALYTDAIDAMRRYSGHAGESDGDSDVH